MENEQQLIIAANSGDPESQYKLGCYYSSSECYGDARNEEEAFKWYKRAAEQGHARAQYQLGYCYYYSMGVPMDELHRLKSGNWWQKLFAVEKFKSQNRAEGIRWYKKAAEQGHEIAKIALESSDIKN